MSSFRVDIASEGQLDVFTDVKEVPASPEVKSPPAFFAVTRHNDSRFAFTLCGEHSEQKSCGKRYVIELYIKWSGYDLVIWDRFRPCGYDAEVRVLKVTGCKAIV